MNATSPAPAAAPPASPTPLRSAASQRRIVQRTRGRKHGPITRLMSPSDLGQRLKPFVFLDLFAAAEPSSLGGFPMHPHSGIATLTYLIEGRLTYEDTTGKSGVLPAGGVEWMLAGGGVWHAGAPVGGAPLRGFQLWVALPPDLENAPPHSRYLGPLDLQGSGPAKVLLGSDGTAASPISAPSPMNYLAVRLIAGERWRFTPPPGHEVAWIAVGSGAIAAPHAVPAGELAVFEESGAAIDFVAESDCVFVLGSAAKHAHELVMGYYSVHTSQDALNRGESGIRAVARRMRAASRESS